MEYNARAPFPYSLILAMFPMLALVGGVFGGKAIVDILDTGNLVLLVMFVYGLPMSGFLIAIRLTYRFAGRGSTPSPKTTQIS